MRQLIFVLILFPFCFEQLLTGEPSEKIWVLENELIVARFGYSGRRPFGLIDVKEKNSGAIWTASPVNNLIWFVLNDRHLSSRQAAEYKVLSYGISNLNKDGKKHSFVLNWGTLDSIVFNVEIFPGQPFLRTSYSYHPTAPFVSGSNDEARFFVSSADLMNWSFETGASQFHSLHLNQWWRPEAGTGNFELIETNLARKSAELKSGAYGIHCSWFAVREAGTDKGIVAGWEFNGRANGSIQHSRRDLNFRVAVNPVNWTIPMGDHFESPASFIGFFKGDWDEAGHITRNFVEKVLMKPMPPGFKFPDVMFDSWGYGTAYGKDVWGEDIDEQKMRRAAEIAARLGAEVFTVDLGWSRLIGDWYDDRRKFPSGLRALSDYVHSLGMKFGLHIALLEAHANAPVLKENPDWTASYNNNYFGAISLCPAHWPVKDWLIHEITRVVKEYNVDWVLQDGENMVKVCTKTTHTHYPQGSNYANAVALDEIVSRIQHATPNTVWENCEDGGNMMTYKMVQNYHTSILEDAAGTLPARRSVHGVVYAFPLRYTLRYMPEQNPSAYDFRSYILGGPIVLMQKITGWSEGQTQLAKRELDLYRTIRSKIDGAKIYHLTGQPNGSGNDAIQAHQEQSDRSVIFIYRSSGNKNQELIKPRGLKQSFLYRVKLQESRLVIMANGRNLMKHGIKVSLPSKNFAEVVYLDPIANIQ